MTYIWEVPFHFYLLSLFYMYVSLAPKLYKHIKNQVLLFGSLHKTTEPSSSPFFPLPTGNHIHIFQWFLLTMTSISSNAMLYATLDFLVIKVYYFLTSYRGSYPHPRPLPHFLPSRQSLHHFSWFYIQCSHHYYINAAHH